MAHEPQHEPQDPRDSFSTSPPVAAPEGQAVTPEGDEETDPRNTFRSATPKRTFGEKAAVVGRGAATGAIRSTGITSGAIAGVAATAPIPIPGARVVGAIVGGLTGFFLAEEAVEGLADPDLFDTPLTFRTLEEVPEDLRPLAIFGETIGGAVSPSAAVVGLAKKGIRVVIDPAAGRLKTFAGNIVNNMMDMASKKTGRFIATEAAATATAATAGAISEDVLPGAAGVRLGAEVTAGILSPTRFFLGLGTDAFNAVKRFGKSLKPEARLNKAGTVLQEYLELAGEDPVALAALLRTVDIEGQPTVAQALGNRAVAAFEAEFKEISREFGVKATAQARQSLDAISGAIVLLRGTGDPEALLHAASLRNDAYRALLTSRVERARAVAQKAADGITDDTPRARSALSVTAGDSLTEAMAGGRAVERELWEATESVPVKSMARLFRELGSIRAEMLDRATLPSLIESTIGDYKAAQKVIRKVKKAGVDVNQELTKESKKALKKIGVTVGELNKSLKLFSTRELMKFRSEVLEQARKAGKAGEDNLSRRMGLLAEAALDDVDRGFKVALTDGVIDAATAGAHNDARAFTREFHNVFTRAFAGAAKVQGRRGELQLPPEALLHKALATGPEMRALRFKELEEATRFLPTQAAKGVPVSEQALQGAVANSDMMLDAQRSFLRLSAAEVIDKETGKVSTKKVADFLSDQEELLDRFPEVRNLLEQAGKTEAAREVVENITRLKINRIGENNAFAKLLKVESGADAVKSALNSPKPLQEIVALSRMARRAGPQANAGLRASIWDHVMRTSMRSDGQSISLPKLVNAINEPIRPGLPSILQIMHQQRLMTLSDIQNVRKLVTAAQDVISTASVLPTGEMVLGGGAEDLTGAGADILLRMIGSAGATKVTGFIPGAPSAGQSLIAAYAGSRLMRQVFQRVPKLRLQDLLSRALLGDPITPGAPAYSLATALLEAPKTTKQAIKLSQQIHAYAISSGLAYAASGDEDPSSAAPEGEPVEPALPQLDPFIETSEEEEIRALETIPGNSLDEVPELEPEPEPELERVGFIDRVKNVFKKDDASPAPLTIPGPSP